MLSGVLVFLMCLHESQQNVCTDLGNFKSLNNTYKPTGEAVHSSLVLGLLHCVVECQEWKGCEAFEFHIKDGNCTLYKDYVTSPNDLSRTNKNVVKSVVKDWPGFNVVDFQKKNWKMKPGYDCFLTRGDWGEKFYKGRLNVTRSGLTCQRWDSHETHEHQGKSDRDEHFSNTGESVTAAGNYCRMPIVDPETAPWCYTTNAATRWEFCAVTEC